MKPSFYNKKSSFYNKKSSNKEYIQGIIIGVCVLVIVICIILIATKTITLKKLGIVKEEQNVITNPPSDNTEFVKLENNSKRNFSMKGNKKMDTKNISNIKLGDKKANITTNIDENHSDERKITGRTTGRQNIILEKNFSGNKSKEEHFVSIGGWQDGKNMQDVSRQYK